MIDNKTELEVSHLLLPVNNIDVILNFATPIKYKYQDQEEVIINNFHFSGLRTRAVKIIQVGKIRTIGISFKPYGLYSLFNIPISKFTDKLIELKDLQNKLSHLLKERLLEEENELKKILVIEEELMKIMRTNYAMTDNNINLFNQFISSTNYKFRVNDFCEQVGISERHLERLFKKYIGISPISFYRLTRFQRISNRLIYNDFSKLSSLALEYDYYDQMHFIKECKSFSGITPSKLSKNNLAVKSIVKYK